MNFEHTCTIENLTGATNALNEQSETYGTPVTSVECKLVIGTRSEVDENKAEMIQVGNDMIYFPIGTNVSKGSRISSVAFQNGDPVSSSTFEVTRAWEHVSPTLGRLHVIASIRSLG